VTFAKYAGQIPQLQANSTGLYGSYRTSTWTDKLQNASYSSLSGGFTLTWRGNTTQFISYNASASEMEAALEALPVIEVVSVQRCCPSAASGFTWTIEFLKVNTYTVGGYVADPIGSLDLMRATSYLVGTNPQIQVAEARRATTGEGAGIAYVYEKVGGVWHNTFVLRGNDTSEADNFGSSVAIYDDLILIGAQG
jgi:hypothetical protein